MRDERDDDFPLEGVSATKEYIKSVLEGPGNLTSYHTEWIRRSGVSDLQAVAHTHKNLTEALRLMVTYDQLDISCLASAELLVRYLIQAEIAVERNARYPEYSGLDIVVAAPTTGSGRASLTKFNTWVSDKLKERSQVWKQERLYREEQRALKKNEDWKGRKGDKDKGKGKGKKGDKGDAGGAGDAPTA